MNYLELVNDVMVRLRENEVSAVTDNAYSKLIGKFVNDAKRQVEDAYNWNALTYTLSATTSDGVFNYALTGSGNRFRVIDVINSESNWPLKTVNSKTLNEWFLNTEPAERGSPMYYNFNGVNANGDTQVDLYPIPDGEYNIFFNVFLPQPTLVNSSDEILVPSEPVIFLAYAKALAERGEDSGLVSSEAYGLYQNSLADHIAVEQSRYPDENIWTSY